MDLSQIQEPMTVATDCVLAVLGVWFGLRLLGLSQRVRQRSVHWWGWAFLATGVAAFSGAVAHGWPHLLGEWGRVLVWRTTVYSIGIASFCFLAGTGRAVLNPAVSSWLTGAAFLKLCLYLGWMSGHDEFRYVIYDYAPSFLLVLVLGLYLWRRRHEESGAWISLGVVVSFLAASVQAAGWSIHQHFNHNDLYHVIQMVGLALLYGGARRLRDY